LAITQVGSTTNTGNAANVTSRAPAVPAGAATDDVAFVFLDLWNTNPAVTPPAGFTLLFQFNAGAGLVTVYCFWKRLTGGDTGTYSFTWGASNWSTSSCTMLRGAKASGDPVGANFNTAFTDPSQTHPSTAVNPGYIPGLLWHGYNDNAGTHTPPTSTAGFTETADVDSSTDAIYLPGSGTSFTVTGGATTGTSGPIAAALVAVEPVAGGAPVYATLRPAVVAPG
jgi:hypothetical protein